MSRAKPFLNSLVAAALYAAVSQPADARNLRVADTHPHDYPTVLALQEMGRLLAERSQGRYTIKVYHSRQLGEEQETIDQVRAGAIDLARVNLTPFNGIVPETQVASLPFLFRSVDHMHRVMDGPIGEEIMRAFEPHGFIGLAFYDAGARSFYNSRHPITSPADMKGLRIRVQQSPVAIAMVEALGASAEPMPYGQVAVALKAGVVDGAENNWPSYEDAGHLKAARYYSATQHMMAPEIVVMSRKVWESLSPPDQALIRKAARDSARHMRRLWTERERNAETKARAQGVKVNTVDKGPFAKAMSTVYDRFLAEPSLRDLVRRVQAVE